MQTLILYKGPHICWENLKTFVWICEQLLNYNKVQEVCWLLQCIPYEIKLLSFFSMYFFLSDLFSFLSSAVQVVSFMPLLLPVLPVLPHGRHPLRSATDWVSNCCWKWGTQTNVPWRNWCSYFPVFFVVLRCYSLCVNCHTVHLIGFIFPGLLWRHFHSLCCWPHWPHWGVSVFSAPTSRPGSECSVDMGGLSNLFFPHPGLSVINPITLFFICSVSLFRAMSVWDTCLQITVAFTLIGAWLGAFPIPLDWDRPWQVRTIHRKKSNLIQTV